MVTELTTDGVRRWIETAAALIEQNAILLTELDAAIGDGDHGSNMTRGFAAIRKKVAAAPGTDIGALFRLVGMTLLSTVGGAAGPLYGGFFLDIGKLSAGKVTMTKSDLEQALASGLADIKRRGKAKTGDKTMVDALTPAIEALRSIAAVDLAAASRAAAEAAKSGAEATTPLQARKGRASYLAERSIGHQDPGATSSWLLLEALAQAFENRK